MVHFIVNEQETVVRLIEPFYLNRRILVVMTVNIELELVADTLGVDSGRYREILKDELEARGISQRKFAAIISVSYSVLNEVINDKRPITTEYALKIEAATGIPAHIWVNMQSAYNMQIARHDSKLSVILDNIRKAVAVL